MLFNSFSYIIFFPIVFILYWFVFDYALKHCKHQVLIQNIFLVLASYVFYAWWDWRFLGLLVGMSVVSWLAGEYLAKNPAGGGMAHSRRWAMWVAVAIDVATLGFFKYYNFFVDSFSALLGLEASIYSLKIVLPLGISFFTFQAISYVVDASHGKLPINTRPMREGWGESLVNCLLYIGFFPKLLAGPIERPTHLLPLIQQKRVFDYDMAVDGCRQILWGLFKKVVVADNCATYVNAVYADYGNQSGSTLLLAAILYTIQIYGDFSGYSDMAIGSGKLLGFRFRDNFLFPYFSRNMGEFWKRWHISLNTWFVDYVYIPLGGSRNGKARTIANTMIIFLLSGLWHGADWSFVAWGGYHGLLLVILILCGWNTKYEHVVAYNQWLPSIKELGQMVLVFVLATIGWMLFRADSIGMFTEYSKGIFSSSLLSSPWLMTRHYYIPVIISVLVMFCVDWIFRDNQKRNVLLTNKFCVVRWLGYVLLLVACLWLCTNSENYIYFQF